jgi:hypothetical protein
MDDDRTPGPHVALAGTETGRQPEATELTLQPLAAGAWEVLDARLPADDVHALLGFVEPLFDQLVVTVVTDPGHTYCCDDVTGACSMILDATRKARSEPA